MFGRERPQVFHVLRRKATQLYALLKQKFHSRTLNIDDPASRITDPQLDVEPRLHTLTSTHTSPTNISSLHAIDAEFFLQVARRPAASSESRTETDKDEPVQNTER